MKGGRWWRTRPGDKFASENRAAEAPTLAKNKPARMGHPKALFGIKARPPADFRLCQCGVYAKRVLIGLKRAVTVGQTVGEATLPEIDVEQARLEKVIDRHARV
jgi:hypothetical protein